MPIKHAIRIREKPHVKGVLEVWLLYMNCILILYTFYPYYRKMPKGNLIPFLHNYQVHVQGFHFLCRYTSP